MKKTDVEEMIVYFCGETPALANPHGDPVALAPPGVRTAKEFVQSLMNLGLVEDEAGYVMGFEEGHCEGYEDAACAARQASFSQLRELESELRKAGESRLLDLVLDIIRRLESL